MNDDQYRATVKTVAWTLWEIRVLLGPGRYSNLPPNVVIAARLAYALHNEALSLFDEGYKGRDADGMLKCITAIDEDLGEQLHLRLQRVLGGGGSDG